MLQIAAAITPKPDFTKSTITNKALTELPFSMEN
jgi:hypothetical protein